MRQRKTLSQTKKRAEKWIKSLALEDTEKEINNALGPGPLEEILSSRFKLQVTRGNILTLENGQWLNDEVINFYMNLLVERNENQSYPALHVFRTFFSHKLKHSVTGLRQEFHSILY